ncbi:MAG: putative sulfate/molybdate transporter [Desulfobacterales bacterium]|nr:putative sulfate/molybdate transporter [Desulfobacterales bacterium]
MSTGKQPRLRFNRMELAGSLGDLGTLLPIAFGMILINDLSPIGVLVAIGGYYILSGLYFGLTVPVQPMKVIGAYALATALSPAQISAAGLIVGAGLLAVGATNVITPLSRMIPKPVIRGVQLSTGALLMSQGVKLMLGTAQFQVIQQAAEPFLRLQHIGPVPIGIVLGLFGGAATLMLLENRTFPAGLAIVLGGMAVGVLLGTHEGLESVRPGWHMPSLLPFGWPTGADFSFALLVLVAPQLPMTVGNAVVANADLSRQYFGEQSHRVTYRGLTISMGVANLASSAIGGMPLCHGAGGLAAHYRFGARTAGSNLMIGTLFIALGIFLGREAVAVLHLLPMAVLGVLLVFAGAQLGLTVMDLQTRKEIFVCLLILGITLATNLAAGFLVGTAAAYALKSEKLHV